MLYGGNVLVFLTMLFLKSCILPYDVMKCNEKENCDLTNKVNSAIRKGIVRFAHVSFHSWWNINIFYFIISEKSKLSPCFHMLIILIIHNDKHVNPFELLIGNLHISTRVPQCWLWSKYHIRYLIICVSSCQYFENSWYPTSLFNK